LAPDGCEVDGRAICEGDTVARKHHELRVWQEAMALVKAVYLATTAFPREERFGLTAQMRRSAVSVPSNIAEGAARATRKEFLHFLAVARGSLSELDTQVRIAIDLDFLPNDSGLTRQIDKIFGVLGALMKSQAVMR
jgi:four helix bundle protein